MDSVLSEILKSNDPWLLIVGRANGLSHRLKARHINSYSVPSAHAAIEMLREVIFSGSNCDGVLFDYVAPDAMTFDKLERFRDEFWDVPLALMMDFENISQDIWSWSRHIPIFKKPLDIKEIDQWLIEGYSAAAVSHETDECLARPVMPISGITRHGLGTRFINRNSLKESAEGKGVNLTNA